MNKYMENAFLLVNYIIYLLYIIGYFGLWSKAPEYLDYLSTVLRTYVGIVLVYFFNPFMRNIDRGFTDAFHTKLAFSAGLALLTNTTIDKVVYSIKKIYSVPFEIVQ